MVLVIALVLTMGATAFMVLSNVETRALNYKTAVVRAELTADSGLSHAIAVINKVTDNLNANPNLVATPDGIWDTDTNALATGDLGLSWASYFQNPSERFVIPTAEFDPYGMDEYTLGATTFTTKVAVFHIQTAGKDSGDYAVLIADMDGRLHTNYTTWGLGDTSLRAGIYNHISGGVIDSAAAGMDTLLTHPWHAFGEFSAACKQLASPVDIAPLRPYLTPYPVNAAPSRININTARVRTIEAIVDQIPSLDATAKTKVVTQLVAERPFKGRRELETAIEKLGPTLVVGLGPPRSGDLTEKQFNDVLNSLNSSGNPSNMSIFSKSANYSLGDPATATEAAGDVYEFDFDPNPPLIPPVLYANTGGDHTSDSDTTWGCEVQFMSRYYEILVLGRGWRLGSDPDAGRGRAAERLLWAIYDSQDKKVIWRRWLFPADR
jgi:hypothetical protein